MTDVFSKSERRCIMQRIRSKHTNPEQVVRSVVRSLGYRYRLHVQKLPGSPDLAFPVVKKVIFVHGCFWHRHRCKRGQSIPTTRIKFWERKFDMNKRRDQRHRRQLNRLGWSVLNVWECQTKPKGRERLVARLDKFLGPQ